MDTRSNILKGKIENVYLFYGEEDYKLRDFKNLLKKKVPFGDAMNFSCFEGKDINYRELHEITTTLPFFAEKRLVIVENTNKFTVKKKKKDSEDTPGETPLDLNETDTNDDKVILNLLEELPETTCLAFFESAAAKNKKVYKLIATKGVCEPCNKDSDGEIRAWIQKGFKSFGLKCDPKTAAFLLTRVGSDYTTLSNEIKKVSSFAFGKDTVDSKDILAISTESIESKIFEMLDAMCDKNEQRVLTKYFDMLYNKEEPLMIIAMIRRQLRIMLQVAELSNKGYDNKKIVSLTGNQEFVINKMKGYLKRHFKMKDIITALDRINETDKAIKSGNIDKQIGVEMLLIELSG